MKLYLIRHPAPQRDPAKPADQWQLSELGRQQAAALAALSWWSAVTRLYTSTETKTVEAAAIIGQEHSHLITEQLTGLNEARRPTEYVSDEEYRARVQTFFEQPDREPVAGWESAEAVRHRIVTTIGELTASLDGDAALISHGLALTLYRAHLLNRPASLQDWQLLTLGCWAIADPTEPKLLRDWTAINI